MINPWFKFYGGEFLSDPKIGSMSAQERSCWITLLCLASTSSTPGLIEYLTVEVLLEKSGIRFDPYHPEEWNALLGILTKFENMRMIIKSDTGLVELVNWNKRQASAMTVTERVKKHRLKQRYNDTDVTSVTNGNETANDRREENRIEKNIETKESTSISFLKTVPADVLEEFRKEYSISPKGIQSKATDLLLWCQSKSKVYKNYKAFLENAIRKDQVQLRTQYPLPSTPFVSQSVKEASEITPEQLKANRERIAKMGATLTEQFKK
ncbi:hypothetical protein [Novosphingobium aquae]|uniref:Lin1244/Lin1753-like N-terminal domain-containing protein n=1 Tax=Novosphingobium aquae TaxID=3133435 RepID=A0ABU8SDX0_9SPHN